MSEDLNQLQPRLDQAQQLLKRALGEVCGTEISEANTGEMIKLEEALAVANEAAKEAISVRRRLRKDREAGITTSNEESDGREPLEHRELVDANGVKWDVFAVHPSTEMSGRSPLAGTYRQGWLAFDAGTQTRRVTPIPSQWQALPDEELERLCQRADVAPRRDTPRNSQQ